MNYFQIHALASENGPAMTRKLTRVKMRQFFSGIDPCLIGMEACGTAHYWAREIGRLGHDARLIPPVYVKPYGAPRRRVSPVEEDSTQRVVD